VSVCRNWLACPAVDDDGRGHLVDESAPSSGRHFWGARPTIADARGLELGQGSGLRVLAEKP